MKNFLSYQIMLNTIQTNFHSFTLALEDTAEQTVEYRLREEGRISARGMSARNSGEGGNSKYFFIYSKFILICVLLLNSTFCCASETINVKLGNDYLILTEKVVQTFNVSDTDIATLSPFFTLFNEKNSLLLHPQKTGKTDFSIFLRDSIANFKLVVSDKKSNIDDKPIQIGDFEIMLLDTPPDIKDFDIDTPPASKEAK